jgi:Leucine-rich repeat (LRR) protein
MSAGQNRLHELPESFGNLRSLRYCQLSKNLLELLPSSFGNLTKLEELRLDYNKVCFICFLSLTHQKYVDEMVILTDEC